MSRFSPTLLKFLRREAQLLASVAPFTAEADGFVDATHFGGPRYYCLFRVAALSDEWQEAGEAETPDDALENLTSALLMAKVRLARLDAEFLPASPLPAQNFSSALLPTGSQVVEIYRRADVAAQLVHARFRAYGASAEKAEAERRAQFRATYTHLLS